MLARKEQSISDAITRPDDAGLPDLTTGVGWQLGFCSRQFLAAFRVTGWHVEAQSAKQRAPGAREHIQPLIGGTMTICWTTLGIARGNRHRCDLRSSVRQRNAKTFTKAKLLPFHGCFFPIVEHLLRA